MSTPPTNPNAVPTNAATGSLMQDFNHEPVQYHVLSPDGLPITPEPFGSLEEAARYIPTWFEMFQHQGFYAAVGNRIPLDEVTYHLSFVPVWPDRYTDGISWPPKPF